MLTLFTTPVIYLGFDSLARRARARFGPGRHQAGAGDAGV
jgi:multidrug efflux pump